MKARGVAAVLLLLGNGIYLTKLVPFSPIYFLATVAFALLGAGFLLGERFKVRRWSLMGLPVVIAAYLVVTNLGNPENINIVVGVVLSTFMLPAILVAGEHVSKVALVRTFDWAFWIVLTLFFIDTAARYSNPNSFYFSNGQAFYAFKFNGIMYMDSNFVGAQIALLFGLVMYLYDRFGDRRFMVYLALLTVLVFATLSRASIAAVGLLILVQLRKRPVILVLVLLTITCWVALDGYKTVLSDESFQSKLGILDSIHLFLTNSDFLKVLFGFGLGNEAESGTLMHNMFVVSLIETGLVGLFLLIALWFSVFRYEFRTWHLFLPFAVNGLSLMPHSVPYLYAGLALVILLEQKESRNWE